MTHFTVVARLGRNVFARSCSDQVTLAMYRVILEHTTHELACHSMFQPASETVLQAIDWNDYERIFSEPAGDSALNYRFSPLCGGNHEFLQLVFQVTCFSRQPHNLDTRTQQVDIWLTQLQYFEQRLHKYYEGVPGAIASRYQVRHRLYGAALRIYCLKVKDHEIRARHPDIKNAVCEAHTIFTRFASHKLHISSVLWPLVVLLCACSDYAMFRQFATDIDKSTTRIALGRLRNYEAVVAGLHGAHQRRGIPGKMKNNDGLGVLLCKESITTYLQTLCLLD